MNSVRAPHRIVEVRGSRMRVNPGDRGVSEVLAADGVWEPLETHVVEGRVRRGDLVLDVGANIGYYTLLFSRLVGRRGHVVAFEPDPVNFALLCENVELNGCRNVTLENAAVSDGSGRALLYLAEENKGDHRLVESADGPRPSIGVEVVTVDEYFAGSRRAVSFAKLDIQGSEAKAIDGMATLIERNPHLELLTEFWPEGLRAAGSDPSDLLHDLLARGFALYHVDRSARVARRSPAWLLANCGSYTTVLCTRSAVDRQELAAYERQRHALPPDAAARWVRAVTDAVRKANSVTGGRPFILVEDGQFAELFPPEAKPFLEREGEYWGAPPDDISAIAELERMRTQGANFVVFAWPSLWWLDYYAEFHMHLRNNYALVHEDESLIAFDLRQAADPPRFTFRG